MEIIRIENLTFYYPGSDIPAIDHFSVSIDSGDYLSGYRLSEMDGGYRAGGNSLSFTVIPTNYSLSADMRKM